MEEKKETGILISGVRGLSGFKSALFISSKDTDLSNCIIDTRVFVFTIKNALQKKCFYIITHCKSFSLITIVNPFIDTIAEREEYIAISLYTKRGNYFSDNARQVLEALMVTYMEKQGSQIDINRFVAKDFDNDLADLKVENLCNTESDVPAKCAYSIYGEDITAIDPILSLKKLKPEFKQIYLFPLTNNEKIETAKHHLPVKELGFVRLDSLLQTPDSANNVGSNDEDKDATLIKKINELLSSGRIADAYKQVRADVTEIKRSETFAELKKTVRNAAINQDKQTLKKVIAALDEGNLGKAIEKSHYIIRQNLPDCNEFITANNAIEEYKKRKGNHLLPVVIIVALLTLAGAAHYYFANRAQLKENTVTLERDSVKIIDSALIYTAINDTISHFTNDTIPEKNDIDDDLIDKLNRGDAVKLNDNDFDAVGLNNKYLKFNCEQGGWLFSDQPDKGYKKLQSKETLAVLSNHFPSIKPCGQEITAQHTHLTKAKSNCTLCDDLAKLEKTTPTEASVKAFMARWTKESANCHIEECLDRYTQLIIDYNGN